MSEPTLTSTLARDWRLDVNTGTVAVPVWTQVRGVSAFTPTITPTTQDDSDYDSGGWGSTTKTMLAWSISATLLRKVSVVDGARDPGQEALREASDQFSDAGIVHVRWYEREVGGEAYSGSAQVNWEPQGGDTTALKSVNVTLLGQGARTVITNPTV